MSSLSRGAALTSSQVPLAGATALLTLVAALADGADLDSGTVIVLLASAQTAALGWLAIRSIDPRHAWASPGVILSGGWFLAFLVPVWIYVFDPGLASGLPVADAVAITTIALLAVICGNELGRLAWRDRRMAQSAAQVVEPAALDRGWAAAWIVAGLMALAVLFAVNGGPVEWITNLDKVGEMARGLTYVIGVVLVVKHVAIAAFAHRLTQVGRLDLRGVALVAAAVVILLPLGARLFVAMLLVEVLVLHAVIVRPTSLRVLLPVAMVSALLLIFGYGTVKRYQTFRAANPTLDRGFGEYVRDRASKEVAAAYANNYADGMLLTAQARSVVPSRVPYEKGKAFVRLAVHPIPNAIRPRVDRDPILERFLGARDGNTHAVPLQAEGYVQIGLLGVVALFALIGAAVALLERALARATVTLPTLITLVVIAVQIPLVIRSGVPQGAAVAGLYALGAYAVARTVLRDYGAPRRDAAAIASLDRVRYARFVTRHLPARLRR